MCCDRMHNSTSSVLLFQVKDEFFITCLPALIHKSPPQIAQMYRTVPFPCSLSPREAVKEAALSICHSVSVELKNSYVVIVP